MLKKRPIVSSSFLDCAMSSCDACLPGMYGNLCCMRCEEGDLSGYRLVLPWPPSVNHYWRHVAIGRSVRTLISAEGRAYKASVGKACRDQQAPVELRQRLSVVVKLEPPDRRRRDIDNTLKALLDSLTTARVWHDDAQIDDLRVYRAACVRGGRATVEIWGRE